MRRLALVTAACLLAMPAGAETLRVRYGVSLIGLTIGTFNLNGTVSQGSYKLDGAGKVSGLAAMMSSSKGAASASGSIAGSRVVPSAYATSMTNGEQQRTVRMAMGGSSVRALEITPPFDERPDRVPLRESDKQGIVDPLSGFVMPVAGSDSLTGPAACSRTIPIFDGGARFDVSLSFTGTREVKGKGYSGPVAVCAARYTPIAGHRNRPQTQFMANNRQIEIWLAPLAQAHVVVPYRISVQTMAGMAVLEPQEFAISGGSASQ